MKAEVDILLLQFKVKNYKSIGDEIILDMVAGSGNEHKNFLIEENGVNILPVASIYGANASGKSNIIDAIYSMFYNITHSYMYGEKDAIRVTPFLYNPELRSKPTEFEIFFTFEGKEYQYGYTSTRDKIFGEWLYERKFSKNDTVRHLIFERNNGNIKYRNIEKYIKLKEYNSLIDDKMLVLSFLGNKDIESAKIFNDIFKWFRSFMVDKVRDGILADIDLWAEFYLDENIKVNFIKFINEFDSSLKDLVIKEELNKDGQIEYGVFTIHEGEKYPIDIESDGTKKLFCYYTILFLYFNNFRGIFFIDELDSQLHPLILRKIVNMFHDKEINKMGSQLIFSSHNLIVLDNRELRRDEIWFTEKNEKGFTELFSLAEFKANEKEIRADMNYGKNYLAGRFGAIPYLNSN